jgi:putative NADPH-quinone reductase
MAYGEAASAGGADVRYVRLANLEFSLLRSVAEFEVVPDDAAIIGVRSAIEWANHLVFVFPLWLGSAPAKLRGLLEQVARGGFTAQIGVKGWEPRLRGKSARLIVTMGMPAFAYRLVFGGHGVKSIRKGILGFAGVAPVRVTLLGGVDKGSKNLGQKYLDRVRALGRRCI